MGVLRPLAHAGGGDASGGGGVCWWAMIKINAINSRHHHHCHWHHQCVCTSCEAGHVLLLKTTVHLVLFTLGPTSCAGDDMRANYEAGHVCWDDRDLMAGRPTGAVRISLGHVSNFEDVCTAVRCVLMCACARIA